MSNSRGPFTLPLVRSQVWSSAWPQEGTRADLVREVAEGLEEVAVAESLPDEAVGGDVLEGEDRAGKELL